MFASRLLPVTEQQADVAMTLPVIRRFNPRPNKTFNITLPANVMAILAQLRGNEMESEAACHHCSSGNGPFESCVVLSDEDGVRYMNGSCANCHFNGSGTRCDFRKFSLQVLLSHNLTVLDAYQRGRAPVAYQPWGSFGLPSQDVDYEDPDAVESVAARMRVQADSLSNRAALMRSGETVVAMAPVLRAAREARGSTRSPVRGGRSPVRGSRASASTAPVSRGRSDVTASRSRDKSRSPPRPPSTRTRSRTGTTAGDSSEPFTPGTMTRFSNMTVSPPLPPSFGGQPRGRVTDLATRPNRSGSKSSDESFMGFSPLQSPLSSPRPSSSRPVDQRSPLSPRSPSESQAARSHVPLTGSPSSFPRGNFRVEIPRTQDGHTSRRDSGREVVRFSPDNPYNEGGFVRGDGSSGGRDRGGSSGGRERSGNGRERPDSRPGRSSTGRSDDRRDSGDRSGQSGSGGRRQ
jgi:hypothetical protein